jgi:hypothetical protein
MALTVFTAADQTVGPVFINRDRPFSYSVQGTLTAGSTVVLERALIDEATWRPVQTFVAASVPHEEDYLAQRGWKYRLRCAVFNAPDTPSAEILRF